MGDGWGSEQSSKLNDGGGLGTCKDYDGVRLGRVGVGRELEVLAGAVGKGTVQSGDCTR